MARARKTTMNLLAGALLALLVVALAGFGIGNFGGSVRTIGSVGDTDIESADYARALQSELRARTGADGGVPSLASPEGQAIAQRVRLQLIGTAALDGETARLGLSVGDAAVRDMVLEIPAFIGPEGTFDRAAYADTLRRNGLTEDQFETRLRREAARAITSGALGAGLAMPPAYADRIIAFASERRDIAWVRLGPEALSEPLAEPTEEDLRAYHDAHPEEFTAPESREVAYAVLLPETVSEGLAPDEAEVRALYDERISEYDRPERRLVERLVFPDQAAAEAAKAALDAGGQTFEGLVTGRGLSLADVDLGDVSQADLGAAGEPVFALDGPGVVGPLASDLGPALFRVNAILAAEMTPFEDVREELAQELSMDRARRDILDRRTSIEDLIAGGATLEDLVADAGMEAGSVTYSAEDTPGLAGYAAFREAADGLAPDAFPTLVELEDGGLAALVLTAVNEAAVREFEDVREAVAEGWRRAETARRLMERAAQIQNARSAGATFEAQGLTADIRTGLARQSFLDGAPDSLMDEVFALTETGQTAAVAGADGTVHLVELTAIVPPDPEAEDVRRLRDAVQQDADNGLAGDVLDLFVNALQAEKGITLNQGAINAVESQFP